MNRVFITGMGIVSPIGCGGPAVLSSLQSGRSGIGLIRSLDAGSFSGRVAGETDFEPTGQGDRFTQLALAAVGEAALQARLEDDPINGVVATIFGSGMGGIATLDSGYRRLYGAGVTRLHPLTIPHSMYNAAASAVAARLGATGPSWSVVSACAAATHAIGQAFHLVRSGTADAALTGGSDAPVVEGAVRAWEGLRVLAPAAEDPSRSCRPFSADRAGLVLAEGAAAFVLESEESMRRRGAEPIAEVLGFGASNDAGHLTDPSVDGAALAISRALADARLTSEQVEYINAHGTGTRANDATETAAIRRVLAARSSSVPVSSTKSVHGHAMGATGAIELAASILALRAGFLPATMHWSGGDPECDLDYVPNEPRPSAARTFLSNSFGFGGMNGVLAVRTS
jgi:nodulation protein E